MTPEVTLGDLSVMYVEAAEGVKGAREAFRKLEGLLPSLKGRKFYGTFQPADGSYRACVVLASGDDPKSLGLETWVIPGGTYARAKLLDWAEHLDDIQRIFADMVNEFKERVDSRRPSLEFYRSQKELVLLLPLT
ncbi:MAG: hypothetical protein ACRDHY_02630 [Anaerolineales bacterium]